MTKRLGLLEWVPNTVPLKSLIDKELKLKTGKGFSESYSALNHRLAWLKSVTKRAK